MGQKNVAGKSKNPFSRGKLRRSLIINSKVSPKQRERRDNPNKRQDDQMRVRFEHNPKVRELISAKKKSKKDTSSYNKEAFIEHVVDFYSGSWEIDKDSVSIGIDNLTDFFKRKHTDLAVCGDIYDRQLLRDFALIHNKEQAKGFISDE
jgi:hypothetical protein